MGNALTPSASLSRTHKILTLLLTAFAVASAVFWVLQVMALPRFVPDLRFASEAHVQPGSQAAGLARALGDVANQAPAPVVEDSTALKLVAVVGAGRQGTALIAFRDQKAQPYDVGTEVRPGLFLVRLGLRSAELGSAPQGATTLTLTLSVPELPKADLKK